MKCEICGSTENLRCCPLMTGDQCDKSTVRPVCPECVCTWFESGKTTAEGMNNANSVYM